MLIKNFNEMKSFLPSIVIKGDITILDDAADMAENNLIENILGDSLHELLLQNLPEDKKIFKICQRIISVSAFIESIPELDLVLTESGFAVHNSQAMSPASRQRVDKLIDGLRTKLDDATDNLISCLMSSTRYDDEWRGTQQFDNITSGLIATYAEFKRYAQYSAGSSEYYPKSYSEFALLYPNLSVALQTEVARYISEDYVSELLEKYRDREVFSAYELKLLELIRYSISSYVIFNKTAARDFVLKAVSYMKQNISHFPTYASSTAAASLENIHEDTPFFSML